MKNWNSLVVSLWSGKYEKPDCVTNSIKYYRTFGNHDMITIASVDGNTATDILKGMWEQTNNYSQNINAGESIHNLFAVASSDENDKFWEEEKPYLFISAIQINFEDNESFENQLKNFKTELSEFLKTQNFDPSCDFSIYNSLDCGDVLLFLKTDCYDIGAKAIHNITVKLSQNHYSYSICGLDTEKALKKVMTEDEEIPKVMICSVLSDVTKYDYWFKEFVKEYPIEFTLNNYNKFSNIQSSHTKNNSLENDEEYIHLSRLGNEDICINIYNCKMKHFLEMFSQDTGIFSSRNPLVQTAFSRLRIQFDSNISEFGTLNQRTFVEGQSVIKLYSKQYKKILSYSANPYVHKALSEILAASENLEKKRFAFDIQDCIRNIFPLFINKILNFEHSKSNYSNYNFNKDLILFTTGLMSIANGSLHADRLFINVPGFNAVTCDAPAKLLVYYTAFIQKLVSILNSESTHEYRFLLCPDLYLGIEVASLFEYEKDDSQLLKARIPIKKLFDPQNLLMELSHEVAHFVGSKVRRRKERISFLAEIIAYNFADRLVRPKIFERAQFDTESGISVDLENDIISRFVPTSHNEWSVDNLLKKEWKAIPQYIKKHLLMDFDSNDENIFYLENAKNKFKENAAKLLSATYVNELTNKVYEVMVGDIEIDAETMDKMFLLSKIIERHVNELLLDEYVKIIERVCQLSSESFADLVMLSITEDPLTYLRNIYESEMNASYRKDGNNIHSWEYSLIGEMRLERIISVFKALNYSINDIKATGDESFKSFVDSLKYYAMDENEIDRATSILTLDTNVNYLSLCLHDILEKKDDLEQLKELYKSVLYSKDLDICIKSFRKCAFDFRTSLMNMCFSE